MARSGRAARCTRPRRLADAASPVGRRDLEHLTRPGDDPGPTGRLHRAWRRMAEQPTRTDATSVAHLASLLDVGIPTTEAFAVRASEPGSFPVAAAAAAAGRVIRSGAGPSREREIVAWMIADLVLAAHLGWPRPIPLLATAIRHPSLRPAGEGRWPAPDSPAWLPFFCAAYDRRRRRPMNGPGSCCAAPPSCSRSSRASGPVGARTGPPCCSPTMPSPPSVWPGSDRIAPPAVSSSA
ncbi:DUF1403 family protein [Microvirga sp. SYSU G3D207]|uniref:DUF1403 family protein n=1 Tax=Microvirga arsenatis TaxID=2692265 RepID=A0ABW9YVD3_9HYPH|nr:DUF1403 family protein [Microvirga arsenatis]NBJ24368.1 DUF1403 family protein [Microvirga arsenatis]